MSDKLERTRGRSLIALDSKLNPHHAKLKFAYNFHLNSDKRYLKKKQNVSFPNLRWMGLPLLIKESINPLLFIYFSLENSNSEYYK